MAGSSSSQGAHQVAQKFRSTTLPRSDTSESEPSWPMRGSSKAGAELPRSTGSGASPAKSQASRAAASTAAARAPAPIRLGMPRPLGSTRGLRRALLSRRRLAGLGRGIGGRLGTPFFGGGGLGRSGLRLGRRGSLGGGRSLAGRGFPGRGAPLGGGQRGLAIHQLDDRDRGGVARATA